MRLGDLSTKLLLQIAKYLDETDLNSLLQTNRFFAQLLTPLFHELALEDKGEISALFWAAARGYEPLVTFLLEEPLHTGYRGVIFALNFAARFGHVGIVKLLLDKEVDIEAYGLNGTTALHEAALLGQEEMVKFLLGNGANIEALDIKRRTPLHCAVGSGSVVMSLMLAELGVDSPWKLDEWLREEIWKLVDDRSRRTVSVLLGNGANTYAREENGDTPLHRAVLLMGDVGDEFTGFTTFKLVCNVNNIDATNDLGDTALYLATILRARAAFEFLVTSGADVDRYSENGRTPLHTAVRAKALSYQAVTILLEHGTNIEARNIQGETPLHYVLGNYLAEPNPVVVSLLPEWGADIENRSNQGYTPLHKAVICRSSECVKVLLNASADIHAEDVNGDTPPDLTPLDLTQHGSNPKIIGLLLDAEAKRFRLSAQIIYDQSSDT